MFRENLALIDCIDRAWGEYHRASEIERVPGRRREFGRCVARAVSEIHAAAAHMGRVVRALRKLEPLGHTPYDAHALDMHRKALVEHVIPLIRASARAGIGLPYFEKFFYLPDFFHVSNLLQLQIKNGFSSRHGDLPWAVRWMGAPKRGTPGNAHGGSAAERMILD